MNTVRVKVDLTRVHIPALSTIGYGYGQLEDGTSAVIVADQRTMQGIGQAIGEGKPPIVLDAEVVATGEIADDIAEQWHDQWAISDTEGDIEQSLPVLVARPVLVAAQAEHRETEARGEGARIFAAARAQREAACPSTRRPRPEQWPPSTGRQRNAGVAMQRRWGLRGSPTSKC